MPSIRSIATAVPQFAYDGPTLLAESSDWLAGSPDQRATFERFVRSARTERRHFIQPVPSIVRMGGLSERAALFERFATSLAEESLGAALSRAGLRPEDIEALVFTSCSCPVIPSIDGMLIERMGLRSTVRRAPIYQYGCAGGVAGLSLADQLAASGGPVALVSVELCSLVFHRDDHSTGHIVGAAIFADGSASAILTPSGGRLSIVASQSLLLPGTRHLMGYDLHDDGSHLRLDKSLPAELAERVPGIVKEFLESRSLHVELVDWWLFHPGGIKILEFLERTFARSPDRARWSRDVLRDVGNLSSSTVLFVTERFLAEASPDPGDLVMLVGIGPGLTVELILMQIESPR